MILLVDNNLPPFLADTFRLLAELEGHRVVHKRTYFGRTDISDVDWMTQLGKERDAAFLTCDKNILKRPPEVAVFRRSKLTGFWLKSKSWKQYIKHRKFHVLAGKLILRWSDLVQVASVGTGQAYEILVCGKLPGLISD